MSQQSRDRTVSLQSSKKASGASEASVLTFSANTDDWLRGTKDMVIVGYLPGDKRRSSSFVISSTTQRLSVTLDGATVRQKRP
jgi:hypothetical protein